MQKPNPLLSAMALAILLTAAPSGRAAARQTTYPLQARRSQGAIDRVEVTFEVAGDLKMIDKGKPQRAKMTVVANFAYDEKSLEIPTRANGTLRSVRYYHKAEGAIQSGDHAYEPGLRDERRLIGVEIDVPDSTVFSPQGPLTSEERELIDLQANSLLLDRLLPPKAMPTGGTWTLSNDLLRVLLGLETITRNGAQSVLRTVDKGIAQIEILGRVEGSVRGAKSRIELKGRYYFDLEAKRITWFGIILREDRSIGHVDTGFDAVARLQMKTTPGSRSEHLTDAALANVALRPTPDLTQLAYESVEGGWRLALPRQWFVITDAKNRAVLRLIDRGDRLAQCNVASLPKAADPNKLTLEAFQKDVAHALGESFKSFVRAGQSHSKADYRVLRVVAQGQTSEIPMQWIYYLVADRHGRHGVLVFVVEQEQLERFGQADRKLVDTLRLVEPRIAAKPEAPAREENRKR